jgi:hypothetical protein
VPGGELATERIGTFDHRLHIAHVSGGDLVRGFPSLP